MTDIRYASMINGLPVVTAPAEIDVITAETFRAVLLRAAADGHATIVVDLTGTRYCDSCGLRVLEAAHRRAMDEGGELRLVLPGHGSIVRVLAITGLNRCIPCFTGFDQALAAPQASHPRRYDRSTEGTKPLVHGMLKASVTTGEAGPVISLQGEADASNAGQLSDVIIAQLASGTLYLTIEAAGLSFADSMAVGILTGAARTLANLGGGLILLHPQERLLRTLTLLGADQVITIRGQPPTRLTRLLLST